MRAGAGRAQLSFPEGFFPTEGFSRQVSPLYARCVLLDDSENAALLSLELTSLPPDEIRALKEIVSRETGVDEQHCWVLVTHTFSAPHLMPPHALKSDGDRARKRELQAVIRTAATQAARDARANVAEAFLHIGTGGCCVNVNRDIEAADGWWIGSGGTGPVDRTVTVLRLDRADETPVAALVHYAVQSSVLDGSLLPDGGKAVSGDLAGAACALLEERCPGMTALFLLGAAGDQAPVLKAKSPEGDLGEEGLGICAAQGKDLADSAAAAMEAARMADGHITYRACGVCVPAKPQPPDIHDLRPARTYDYRSEGERETEIEALCIGPAVLLGVKPELNCVTAREIKEASPFPHTLVMTLVNGGAKYMADAGSYDRITYEAMNSPFGRGAAELLRDAAGTLINDMETTSKEGPA